MRVIAGIARGQPLAAPRDRGTRPITDRVKETLFAILGERVPEARILDLYAGSGAIGIEALSRGAASATFVEQSRAALVALNANLERTRLAALADVRPIDVGRFLAAAGPESWDLVFLDPPYELRDIVAPLRAVAPHVATDANGRDQAFLADRPARCGRAANGSPAQVRRDDAQLLGGTRPMTRVAVFPGSFDPMTNAHLDVARRASGLFDRLIIGVLNNPKKAPLFSIDERVDLIARSVADLGSHVSVDAFDGLTVELRAAPRRRLHRPRASRRERLRGRAADGADQSEAGAGDRHHLPDDRARVRLRELLADQGGGALRRRHQPHGSGAGRGRARRATRDASHAYNRGQGGCATDIIFLVERLETMVAAGQEAAAHEQRRARPGDRTRADRPAPRVRARRGPPGAPHHRGGGAHRRARARRGRRHHRPCAGAGRSDARGARAGACRAAARGRAARAVPSPRRARCVAAPTSTPPAS